MVPANTGVKQVAVFPAIRNCNLQVLAPRLGAEANPVLAKEGAAILARALQVGDLHSLQYQHCFLGIM